jgi:hypothetical protein
MGTCFDILTKPMPLLQRHVDAYRARVIQGSHNKLRKDKMGEVVDFDIGNDSIDAADSRESQMKEMTLLW